MVGYVFSYYLKSQLHFDSSRNEIHFIPPFAALLNRIWAHRYSNGNVTVDESKWRVLFPVSDLERSSVIWERAPVIISRAETRVEETRKEIFGGDFGRGPFESRFPRRT